MIETRRLILRQWRDSDCAPFAAMNADADVMRHFPAPLTREESDALANRIAAVIDARGYGLFALERRDDGAFIGFTGLWDVAFPCPVNGEVEIGWRLCRDAWGRGYATEAALAALDFGFDGLLLPRIVSFTTTTNAASQAVMRRIGMERREALDFDHPRIDPASPLRRHVVFVAERVNWTLPSTRLS